MPMIMPQLVPRCATLVVVLGHIHKAISKLQGGEGDTKDLESLLCAADVAFPGCGALFEAKKSYPRRSSLKTIPHNIWGLDHFQFALPL